MTEARLQAVLEGAARAAEVPQASAAVWAPRRGLHWAGAVGGDAAMPLRTASITKLFTAGAALRLVEDGRWTLETPLAALAGDTTLAQLAAAGYRCGEITLSHLLTHCSGLPDHGDDDYARAVAAAPARRWTRHEQVAHAMRLGAPRSAPGEAYGYSDTGYVILGEAIERQTGRTLAGAVRELLALDRLGLQATWWEGLEPAPPQALPRARQFIGAVETTDFDPSFDLHGGGGIVATAMDLARFNRALFRGELFADAGTLAAALTVPVARREPGARMHARLGYALPLGRGRWGHGHTGFWGCGVATCCERDVTVALALNRAALPQPGPLLEGLAALLEGAA